MGSTGPFYDAEYFEITNSFYEYTQLWSRGLQPRQPWDRARARGAGLSRPSQHTVTFPLRDYVTQKIWQWNREGRGRTRTGTSNVESSRQDGWVQRGRGAGRPRKHSSVRSESRGTRTVVQGKGECTMLFCRELGK